LGALNLREALRKSDAAGCCPRTHSHGGSRSLCRPARWTHIQPIPLTPVPKIRCVVLFSVVVAAVAAVAAVTAVVVTARSDVVFVVVPIRMGLVQFLQVVS